MSEPFPEQEDLTSTAPVLPAPALRKPGSSCSQHPCLVPSTPPAPPHQRHVAQAKYASRGQEVHRVAHDHSSQQRKSGFISWEPRWDERGKELVVGVVRGRDGALW